MMTSQKLHAKIFLQHGRENVFCITICVIHHTAHFSAFFLTHATHVEDFVVQKLIQLMQLMQTGKFKSLHEQQKHA